MLAAMRTPPPPLPRHGESDTLESRITVGKSVLLYSTIYILCRVAAAGVSGGEGGDNWRGESEVLKHWCTECRLGCVFQIICDWKYFQKGGGALEKNEYPTPLSSEQQFLCITHNNWGWTRLSAGSWAEAIGRWWRSHIFRNCLPPSDQLVPIYQRVTGGII